jgi:hypothetical protein
MDPMTNSFTPKGFWSRPEGTTAMITLAVVACFGIWGLSFIMPFIISLLEDVLYASLLAGGVIVIGWTAMQPRFWTLGSYFFKSIMRAVTSIFITIDPIGILKGYVVTLRKRLQDMLQQIEELRGNMRILQEKIAKNEREIDQSMSMAKAARDAGKALVVQKNARSADRKQKSNMTYEDLYKKMEAMYRVLIKYSEAADYMIADITDEVEEATEKKKLIDKASRAMSSAKKILQGSGDDSLLYNETMEFLADDYGQKLGEIENFMDMSKATLEQIDIENMAAEDSVFQQLEAWENKRDSIVIGAERKKALPGASVNNGLPVNSIAREQVPVSSSSATPAKKYLKN